MSDKYDFTKSFFHLIVIRTTNLSTRSESKSHTNNCNQVLDITACKPHRSRSHGKVEIKCSYVMHNLQNRLSNFTYNLQSNFTGLQRTFLTRLDLTIDHRDVRD